MLLQPIEFKSDRLLGIVVDGSFEKRVGNEEKVLIFQCLKINDLLEIQKSYLRVWLPLS